MRRLILFLFAAAFLLPVSSSLRAQTVWTSIDEREAVSLEVLHPLSSEARQSALSSVFFLSGRWNVGGSVFIEADLPYVYAPRDHVEARSYDGYDDGFGRPYLGASWAPAGRLRAGVGLRVPLGNQLTAPAMGLGRRADAMRRAAFQEGVLPLFANAAYTIRGAKGGYRLLGSVGYLHDLEEEEAGGGVVAKLVQVATPDLALNLGAEIYRQWGPLRAAARLSGHQQSAFEGGRQQLFSEPFLVQARLHVRGRLGSWRPGLVALLPLQAEDEDTSPTLGLHLTYAL